MKFYAVFLLHTQTLHAYVVFCMNRAHFHIRLLNLKLNLQRVALLN